MNARLPIGQMLVQAGYLDALQLRAGLAHQTRWGGRLGEAFVHLGFVTEEVVLAQVARQHGVPYVQIGNRNVESAVVRLVPEKVIRARCIFPIARAAKQRRGLLVVATSQPQDLAVLDEVAFATGMAVRAALASDRDIEQAIERHLGAVRMPQLGSAAKLTSMAPQPGRKGFPGYAA